MDVINQVKISMQIYFYGRKRHSPRTACQSEITKSPLLNNDTEFKRRFAAIEEKLDLIEPYKVADIKAIDTLVTNLKPHQGVYLLFYKVKELNIL
jgi:hypothetical protein